MLGRVSRNPAEGHLAPCEGPTLGTVQALDGQSEIRGSMSQEVSLPRHGFKWINLPRALLSSLSRDLDLGNGDPAEVLRLAFGARPSDAFVREAWSSLRDHWLA